MYGRFWIRESCYALRFSYWRPPLDARNLSYRGIRIPSALIIVEFSCSHQGTLRCYRALLDEPF
jgi:hypothetical protein